MASPISHLRTDIVFKDGIRNSTDIERVNQRLRDAGFSQIRVRSVNKSQSQLVSPIRDYPVSSSANIQTMVSPDSLVPCDSPDCPIKDVPHNLGRYFHNGENIGATTGSGAGSTIGGLMVETSDAFNHTVPPPEIVISYMRTRMNVATQTDFDNVRQFMKHHMWSPTERPHNQYVDERAIHGQIHAHDDERNLFDGADSDAETTAPSASSILGSERVLGNKLGLLDYGLASRPLVKSDFEDSDGDEDEDEDEEAQLPQYKDFQKSEEDQDLAEISENRKPPMRIEIPQGDELMSEKLKIQERILRRMATQQCLRQAKSDSWNNDCDHDDEAFEVLLETKRGLSEALVNGGFKSILDDKHENSGFSDAEYAVLCDAQILLQKAFADTLASARRPFRPSGVPVHPVCVQNELRSVIKKREKLLSANPGKTIAEIVEQLSREGKDLLCVPTFR